MSPITIRALLEEREDGLDPRAFVSDKSYLNNEPCFIQMWELINWVKDNLL